MARQFVIDPSALAQMLVTDTFSSQAAVLARWMLLPAHAPKAVQLSAIEFTIVECTNILWKRHSHFGLPLSDAQSTLDKLDKFPLALYSALPLMKRSLALAAQYKLAVYDTAYIALAEIQAIPLISADQKQIDAATKVGIAVNHLSTFPVTP